MIADRLRKAVLQAAIQGKLLNLDNVEYKTVYFDNQEFEIPTNWQFVKIGELGNFQRGKGINRSQIIKKGFPAIRYGELYTTYNLFIDEVVSFVPESIYSKSYKINYGDILFTLTGETDLDIAKSVSYLCDEPASLGGDLAAWMNHDQDPKYLSYALSSPFMISQKAKSATGNIIVHSSVKKISNMMIILPPFEEQKLIVEKLEVLLAEIDKLEQDEKALKDLEDKFPGKLKNAILRNAVSGKLTNQNLEVETTEDIIVLLEKKKNEKIEVIKSYNKQPFDIPENWRWIKIGDLGTMGMGQTLLKKDMVEKGDPVYSATISDDPLGYVNKDNNKLKLTKGDFVIPARGASIGYVNLIKVDEASSTQTTMYIKSYLPSISNYIYYCLLGMKKDVFTTTGTAQPQITVGLTKEQLIPLPPLEEQKRIVEKLDELFRIDLLNM